MLTRCETDGLSVVVAFEVGLVVDGGRSHASFQALVSLAGSLPLVVSDVEIARPRTGWEIRTSGLWADHVCETPFHHWSFGLEAFALAIEDPGELLGRGFGHRTPLGWELDFESDEEPVSEVREAYGQAGVLHGVLLLADGERELMGPAFRSHRWGSGEHPTPPRSLGLTGSPGSGVALPTPDGVWWVNAGG